MKKPPNYHQSISDLQQIPGVGSSIAKDLIDIGIEGIDDLKGKATKDLYKQLDKMGVL